MKSITRIFIYISLISFPFWLKATHIIGGTAGYQVININNDIATIQMEFYLYRDGTTPAQFDDSIQVGSYGFVNDEYKYISKQTVDLIGEYPIEFDNIEDCPLDLFPYTVGIYSFQMNIPMAGFDHYTISYQRCCRDLTVSNILLPGDTGIAITLDIFPKAFEIQEPILPLKTEFPVQVEPGKLTSFDLSIEDDFEKQYYLSTPQASDGILGSGEPGDPFGCQGIIPDPENCPPEYADVLYIHPDHPYGIGAEINLDVESGVMSVDIPEISKVLVGVTLDRFADDELVCRARQQIIINSVMCNPVNTNNFKNSDFAVWPVPAKDFIRFNIPLKQVGIYDVTGEDLSIVKDEQYVSQLDISDLSKGLYYLSGLTGDGKWVRKKIVKID